MIVTEAMAREAWDLLRSYARVVSEEWDEPHMVNFNAVDERTATRAFRAASRNTHPDMGGTAEKFASVDRAKCIMLEWQKKKPAPKVPHQKRKCPDCEGKGHVIQSSGRPGRKGLRRQCPRCHGSGDLDLDLHGLY